MTSLTVGQLNFVPYRSLFVTMTRPESSDILDMPFRAASVCQRYPPPRHEAATGLTAICHTEWLTYAMWYVFKVNFLISYVPLSCCGYVRRNLVYPLRVPDPTEIAPISFEFPSPSPPECKTSSLFHDDRSPREPAQYISTRFV